MFSPFYIRISRSVFFLFPTIAVGLDIDGRMFWEVTWLCVAIGIGDA